MSDQEPNQQGGMPPKQSPFKPIQPAGASPSPISAAPRTVILKKPSGLRAVPPATPAAPAPAAQTPAAEPAKDQPSVATPIPTGVVLTHEQAAKKMTARINVSSATAPISPIIPPPHAVSGEDEGPRTIRLRSLIKEAAPAPAPAPAQAPALTPVQPPITKSKTSRITLDTALNTAPSMPQHAEPPKTIRLKRPTDMAPSAAPQVTIKPPTTNIAIPPPPAPEGAPSPIKLATPNAEAPAAEEPSPTRRKTIKVKRPGSGSSDHKIALDKDAQPGQEAAVENIQNLSAPDLGIARKPVEKVNPFFIVAAVIAIIITINLMWVFAAQAFGPQAAVADFATISGPNLPTPPGAQTINY